MSLNFFDCFAVLTYVHLFNFFSWRRGIKNLRWKTWNGQQSCLSTKFLPRTFTPFSLARFFFSINRNIFSPSVGIDVTAHFSCVYNRFKRKSICKSMHIVIDVIHSVLDIILSVTYIFNLKFILKCYFSKFTNSIAFATYLFN